MMEKPSNSSLLTHLNKIFHFIRKSHTKSRPTELLAEEARPFGNTRRDYMLLGALEFAAKQLRFSSPENTTKQAIWRN